MEELQKIVAGCGAAVAYAPLSHEVDYREPGFPLMLPEVFLLPSDRTTDPFEWAGFVGEKFKDKKVCILIPGSRFDTTGTRHGQGGGWYDRFLSAVPSHWPRIGVLSQDQLSDTPLIRQPWDQPVDWLVVKDKFSWTVHKTD